MEPSAGDWRGEASAYCPGRASPQFRASSECKAKKEQKRRPKPKDGSQLLCGVCGDKALGYNFDAVTCESCKAFFRRNATKAKTFSCSFDGNCKLDAHTRKFCSGCRLKKCFAIGMKKEWILSDDQLAKRRKRLRERVSSGNPSVSSMSEADSGEISSSSQMMEDSPALGTPLPASPEMHIKDEPFGEENYSVPLKDDIRECLSTMQKTYDEIFEATYTEEQAKAFQSNPKSATELFNMTDIFIRRLIKFAKCIPEFKNLAQEDQIHLLKGGIMEMFVLRSAMGFDLKSGGWKHRKQSIEGQVTEGKLDTHKVQSQLGSKLYMDHMMFVHSIHELTSSNRMVLMLLFVIDLMSSDRPNLNNKLLVSQGQEKFSMWLKAYLESVLTVGEARVLYPKLLMKLLDVRSLGEESSQMASSLDISRLEPLLVEVFDLNK